MSARMHIFSLICSMVATRRSIGLVSVVALFVLASCGDLSEEIAAQKTVGDPEEASSCRWTEGNWDYCRDCGPCPVGVGDCDNDAECDVGLVCQQIDGAVDVCESTCPWDEGDWHYCRDCGPCPVGVGDCDSDAECEEGLFCQEIVGGLDVCESACFWQEGDWNYCRDCGPCSEGVGDCDSDAECSEGLVCQEIVGGLDVCSTPLDTEQTVVKLSILQGRYPGDTCEDDVLDVTRRLNDFYAAATGNKLAIELDSHTVSPLLLDESTRICDGMSSAQSALQEEAAAAGVDFQNADLIMNMFSWGCPMHNATYNNPNSRFKSCTDTTDYVIPHEIGHNFGLVHSVSDMIRPEFADRLMEVSPEVCQLEDPGDDPMEMCFSDGYDPLDIMSGGGVSGMDELGLSPAHLVYKNWITESNVTRTGATSEHTIFDYALQRNDHNLLFVLADTMWDDCPLVVSFALGFVIVHSICLNQSDYFTANGRSRLLDQLEVGQTFWEEEVAITFQEALPGDRATVLINYP